jgi:hypothetical protein
MRGYFCRGGGVVDDEGRRERLSTKLEFYRHNKSEGRQRSGDNAINENFLHINKSFCDSLQKNVLLKKN